MVSDLFEQIEGFLEDHKDRMRERHKFVAAMTEAEYHAELWDAVRPFIKSPSQYRHAAAFMAAMLRERSRD